MLRAVVMEIRYSLCKGKGPQGLFEITLVLIRGEINGDY